MHGDCTCPRLVLPLLSRSFLDIARQAGDQEVEGRACIAYAECQTQLGQLAGAIESLEAFLQLSRSQVGLDYTCVWAAANVTCSWVSSCVYALLTWLAVLVDR